MEYGEYSGLIVTRRGSTNAGARMPSSPGELVGMVGSKKDPRRRIKPVKQSSGLKYRRAGAGVQ